MTDRPAAASRTVGQAGHLPPEDQPDQVAALLAAFLVDGRSNAASTRESTTTLTERGSR